METPTTFQAIVARRKALTDERAAAIMAHNKFLSETAAELVRLDSFERMLMFGIDVARVERARAIIKIEGLVTEEVSSSDRGGYWRGCRARALEDAKNDIATGGIKIATQYFGVKNFSGFGDQREDHTYNFGPRHGSIVFSVGLTSGFRAQKRGLTPDEIEDALYLLTVLPALEDSTMRAA